MNPSTILDTIKVKLSAASYRSVLEEIEKKISEGSTSTEIWMKIGHYLKHLDQVDLNAYMLVKGEVEELDNYLWSIGLKLS